MGIPDFFMDITFNAGGRLVDDIFFSFDEKLFRRMDNYGNRIILECKIDNFLPSVFIAYKILSPYADKIDTIRTCATTRKFDFADIGEFSSFMLTANMKNTLWYYERLGGFSVDQRKYYKHRRHLRKYYSRVNVGDESVPEYLRCLALPEHETDNSKTFKLQCDCGCQKFKVFRTRTSATDEHAVVKAICKRCKREYVIFDSSRHGFDAVVKDKGESDDCQAASDFKPIRHGTFEVYITLSYAMSFEDFSDKYSGCDFDTYLRAFSRIEISGFNDYIGNKSLYVADTQH